MPFPETRLETYQTLLEKSCDVLLTMSDFGVSCVRVEVAVSICEHVAGYISITADDLIWLKEHANIIALIAKAFNIIFKSFKYMEAQKLNRFASDLEEAINILDNRLENRSFTYEQLQILLLNHNAYKAILKHITFGVKEAVAMHELQKLATLYDDCTKKINSLLVRTSRNYPELSQ